MTKIITPTDVFMLKLQALYDIEQQLEKALPKMAKAATDPELADGFMTHLEETKGHIDRLEQIFGMLDAKPKKTASEGIRGIIEDGTWVIQSDAPAAIKDSMLASAARYAEHYEMAGYLSAIEEAGYLEFTDAVDLLTATLSEEQIADTKLAAALKKNLETAAADEEE